MSDLDENIILETEKYSANNYHPLDVVIEKGEGVWVQDVNGKRYLDMISAYSAVSQGHRHPKIISALVEQAGKITLTSRAMHNDKMGLFLRKLCEMSKFDRALPMNSGAEAVETALKIARKWGYTVKNVPENSGEIIVCSNNFHGRTITIISFSSEPQYKDKFGPLTPGFISVEYGNFEEMERAVTKNTIAILVEPIQGEGGIIVPPAGYLEKLRKLATKENILLILDEIQTGLGRTGKLFAYQYEDARPDLLILGKALSGGVYPVSAVLADSPIMDVIKPGDHGSTFGGNPLAAAVGIAALEVIEEEHLSERSFELGNYFLTRLREMNAPAIKEIRGKGLFIGIEIKPEFGKARKYVDVLIEKGILCKDTHAQTIRFAPPLVIKKEELDWVFSIVSSIFSA